MLDDVWRFIYIGKLYRINSRISWILYYLEIDHYFNHTLLFVCKIII